MRRITVRMFGWMLCGAALAHCGPSVENETAPAEPTTAVSQPAVTPGALWISRTELMARPMSGVPWDTVKRIATGSWGTPNIQDQESSHDVRTYAGALYAMRTGDAAMRQKVRDAILAARETENGGRVLALSWNLLGYVLAADVIDLRTYDPAADQAFRTWLSGVRREAMTECTDLIACSERRPNNWGTHALAARIAADMYLGDTTDLARAVQVFRGWLGDRAQYAGFDYGSDLSWQCNSAAPVGINPRGCTRSGLSIDGVLPDDQRRAGSFTTTPPRENYVYTALQGAVAAAALLHRAGYPAFEWSDRALVRAFNWTHNTSIFNPPFTASDTDDRWLANVMNAYAATSYPTYSPQDTFRNISFADWTHIPGSTPPPPPEDVDVSLPVSSVTASADDGNVPANTRDGNLATRWSAQGDGQWIQFDLGASRTVSRVDIAFYLGDARTTRFDVLVSADGVAWTQVFTGQSSGTTLQKEVFDFTNRAGRHVRVVGHGSSTNTWNSLTEVDILGL